MRSSRRHFKGALDVLLSFHISEIESVYKGYKTQFKPEKEVKATTFLEGTPDEAIRELLIQMRASNLL